MGVKPEILTELAINAAKDFLSKENGDLSEAVAAEVRRAEKIHKSELSETQVRTVCQMSNRAAHKALFKRDRHVDFAVASPEKVTDAMKPKKEKHVGAPDAVIVRKSGPSSVTSGERRSRKVKINFRSKLPGERKRKKVNAAEIVVDRIQKVASAVNDALREIPSEEVFGLALIVDESRGNSRLQRLLQDSLEKKAGLKMSGVAGYMGMTPDPGHPLVQAMTRFQDAVDAFVDASGRADRAWVG